MLEKIVQSFRQEMFFFGLWRRRVEWKIPSSFNKSRTFDLWLIVQTLYINPRTYTEIHTPTVVQGGWMKPPLEFLICCSISKRLYLQWKAFDLLYKMRYILWVVALLGVRDVTNNGRHLGRHLGFHQELKIRLKPREMVCLTWKITHK